MLNGALPGLIGHRPPSRSFQGDWPASWVSVKADSSMSLEMVLPMVSCIPWHARSDALTGAVEMV